MKLRAFRLGWEHFRNSEDRFLLVHRHGEYQYRNPDSVYIHPFETFKTRAEAEDYLDQRVPKAEQDEWQLFELVERAR